MENSPLSRSDVEVVTRALLNFIIVLAPLGTILVPLTVILFVFSPPHSRRHPVFILNVLACCLGIAEVVVSIILNRAHILDPVRPIPKGLLTTSVVLISVTPLLVDSILIFRIAAFYPFDTTPMAALVAIFALPLLVKCGRLTAIVMFLKSFTKEIGDSNNIFLNVPPGWHKNPFIMVEWIMQIVDNAYSSSIFLYKLWEFHKGTNGAAAIRSRSLLSCLRSLFVIALGNFIFPVIMNIALIVLSIKDSSFVNGSFILLANNYVSILGVVFATVWTRQRSWNRQEEPFKGERFRRRRVQIESGFAFESTLNTRSLFSIPAFRPAPESGVRETSILNNSDSLRTAQGGDR